MCVCITQLQWVQIPGMEALSLFLRLVQQTHWDLNKIAAFWLRFYHDDIIKWKHFSFCWPFVWGIHRSLVNSPHKGQWCRALMFSLICAWTNGWINNRDAGNLRRHHANYDVTVMLNIIPKGPLASQADPASHDFGNYVLHLTVKIVEN